MRTNKRPGVRRTSRERSLLRAVTDELGITIPKEAERARRKITESGLSEHVALSVAAHMACIELALDPLSGCDARHITSILDTVGNALARVAKLYVKDSRTGNVIEITPAELDGATVRRDATLLVLKDGRTLSSVLMKRADLRQAIAVLKVTGTALEEPQSLESSAEQGSLDKGSS